MTYAVTAAQMREAERAAIVDYKIPALLLMENAAVRTARHIPPGPCVIFCGTGNNGGDGFALARQLAAQGRRVTVVSAGKPATEEAALNYAIVKQLPICVIENPFAPDSLLASALTGSVTLIDALFGTGLTRPAEGIHREIIRLINSFYKPPISLDIPSGLHADTGQPLGMAVKAGKTVTYGYAKTGLLLYPGVTYAGEVIVEGISLPIHDEGQYARVFDDYSLEAHMPERLPGANKGSHGRVCAVAGSTAMPGAAVLACMAAYRIGAGLVDACVTEEVANVIHQHLPEAITSAREQLDDSMTKADAIVIGPGLGQSDDARALVRRVLENAACPVVLDADGLNAVAVMGTEILNAMKAPCVITPHPGEMARLTGLSAAEIVADPMGIAQTFSSKHGVHVLLKGARTVIAWPGGPVYINTSGCSALAKAGTGDVLAGIIGGLLAQGKELPEAAALGAFAHGRAGEKAAQAMPEYAVCARDVVNYL